MPRLTGLRRKIYHRLGNNLLSFLQVSEGVARGSETGGSECNGHTAVEPQPHGCGQFLIDGANQSNAAN